MIAVEIVEYIEKNSLHISSVSFIAHSMGGLVTRAALRSPVLAPLISLLHTFISLASPHLGIIYGQESTKEGAMGVVLPSAIWLYSKMRKSASLQELRLSDNSDIRLSVLYSLSEHHGLAEFQNVILVGSSQDLYANSSTALLDDEYADTNIVYEEMIQNIFSSFYSNKITLLRLNVMTPMTGVRDKGHAAHINFLDSNTFIQMMTDCYGHLLFDRPNF